jgi:hypothetical protein
LAIRLPIAQARAARRYRVEIINNEPEIRPVVSIADFDSALVAVQALTFLPVHFDSGADVGEVEDVGGGVRLSGDTASGWSRAIP